MKKLSTVDFTLKSDFEGGFLCFLLKLGLESKADVAEGGSLHPRCGGADTQAGQDWDAKVGFPTGIGIAIVIGIVIVIGIGIGMPR